MDRDAWRKAKEAALWGRSRLVDPGQDRLPRRALPKQPALGEPAEHYPNSSRSTSSQSRCPARMCAS